MSWWGLVNDNGLAVEIVQSKELGTQRRALMFDNYEDAERARAFMARTYSAKEVQALRVEKMPSKDD